LRGHLAALKLHRRRDASRFARPRRQRETLAHRRPQRLLALEVEATEARRLAGRLRFASLPTPATLEEFDYDAQPAADRALIQELATCRYLASATNVLLIGPPGTGKTHRETCSRWLKP
jgi:DNA replication protein DnaC